MDPFRVQMATGYHVVVGERITRHVIDGEDHATSDTSLVEREMLQAIDQLRQQLVTVNSVNERLRAIVKQQLSDLKEIHIQLGVVIGTCPSEWLGGPEIQRVDKANAIAFRASIDAEAARAAGGDS